jgi:hypothetical protein
LGRAAPAGRCSSSPTDLIGVGLPLSRRRPVAGFIGTLTLAISWNNALTDAAAGATVTEIAGEVGRALGLDDPSRAAPTAHKGCR